MVSSGRIVLLCLLPGVLVATLASSAEEAPRKFMVYVGTYTVGTKSKGIYRMELDLATGKLSEPKLAGTAANPSFLAIHPTGKFLYTVEETGTFDKTGAGGIAAFSIDQKTGDLTMLNRQSSGGGQPCHLCLDKEGKYALAANYGGGSACALAIEDGKLGKHTGFTQHKGKSVNKARQEGPHAHSINLDPANHFAFVADLGMDKVMIYRFEKGKFTLNDPPSVSVKPGAGPRHFAFHPSGKTAYLLNELDSTLQVFRSDPKTGTLESLQTLSTLPRPRFKRPDKTEDTPVKPRPPNRRDIDNTTAEVVVHPSGKFVYCSNRGHNSITAFDVEPTTGQLSTIAHQDKDIKTPRNFAIDPTGKYCLVANQDSASVIVFKVDSKRGKLEPTKHKAEIPTPVCVRFLAWPPKMTR